MRRETLWLAAGQLLCLAAVGWLWSESRSMREHMQATGHAIQDDPAESEALVARERNETDDPFPSKNTSSRKNRQALRPPIIAQPDRTTPITVPEESPNDKSTPTENGSRTGNLDDGRTGRANYIHPVVGAVTVGYAGSHLKNGGFEEGLEPWTCKKGKVVEDPDQEQNSILEITLDEEGFLLSQPFHWPAGHKELTFAFRVKSAKAAGDASTEIAVNLLNEEGEALPHHLSHYDLTEEWAVKTVELRYSARLAAFAPTAIAIRGTRGDGGMWIDDVILK